MLKKELGQVFTKKEQVEEMISLIENTGSILEPSAGNGAFYNSLPKERTIGIEIDKEVAPEGVEIKDFFTENRKFDTIIGNPPYLMNKEILPETKKLLPNVLNSQANLYMFFIWRCLDLLEDNGELIFLVPRDFIKLTSAIPLNKRLNEEGGFTFWKEFGDQKIFDDACPNVVIFRWQKGIKHKIPIFYQNGFFTFAEGSRKLSDYFDIYVGAVSGANDIYYSENGNIELAFSKTKETGEFIKAIHNDKEKLLPFKEKLLERKATKFTEANWWKWVREPKNLPGDKILVNTKTRDLKPFYISNASNWDGSLLALIPKKELSLSEWVLKLNSLDWEKLGFKVGGRLIFSQKALFNLVFS